MCGLSNSHLNLSEDIVMVVPCTLIHSLEAAIYRKKCSYPKKVLKYRWQGTYFQVKFRSEACYKNF